MKKAEQANKRAIRAALAAQGRTQGWLARQARVSEGYLSRLLDGYTQPTDDVANRIRQATGVELRPEAPTHA